MKPRPPARRFGTASAMLCVLFGAAPASGQTMDQVMTFMNEGGAWLSLDIVDGRGSYTGLQVPTMGMPFEGWFQIADVHRGEWDIRVVDLARSETEVPVMDVTAVPGVPVPVSYEAGATARVHVDVRWSEAADTTLWVWVGLPGRPGPGGAGTR